MDHFEKKGGEKLIHMVDPDIHLKADQLTVGYREGKFVKTILEDINLQLISGELVCLMGPNGVGKSTLIRTLCGLQKPLSGDVFIAGYPINSISVSERSKLVSVVLTDRLQGGNLTVQDLIEMGRYPYLNWLTKLTDQDHKAIKKAIDAIGLEDILPNKIHHLSDGQLQRAMIARALVQDGEVMILDEPTAHLDLNNRVEVMRLLRRLAHDFRKTILMATHELDLALQLADRLILIQPDRKLIEGIPEDLVLNGSLDKTFVMKGYDLKTGKAEFKAFRKNKVSISAEGYHYLWTKNVLERNGYEVIGSTENAAVKIFVNGINNNLQCKIEANSQNKVFNSFQEMINFLNTI